MSDVPARLGKYEIIRVLGSGAMGVVYEAVDRLIDRRVAIKTIRNADLDEEEAAEQLRRFLIEARAAGKLNHPHIVSLYDHGEEAGITYLVMELVEGRELQRCFDQGEAFSLGAAVRLMGELLDALGFSHQQGVVHRDVKPENIFITQAGAVKLGDFGIARIESTQKTRAGVAMGTPSHMAPEQIRGEAADGRSDLYAAGVVLYQLLTGRRPFSGTMLSMAMKVLNETAPKASSINPQLPRKLDDVVARALEKNAENRFQSAAEFWQALTEAVGSPTPAAAPLADANGTVESRLERSETSTSASFNSKQSGVSRAIAPGKQAPTVALGTTPPPKPPRRRNAWPIALGITAGGLIALLVWAMLRWPQRNLPDQTTVAPTTIPESASASPIHATEDGPSPAASDPVRRLDRPVSPNPSGLAPRADPTAPSGPGRAEPSAPPPPRRPAGDDSAVEPVQPAPPVTRPTTPRRPDAAPEKRPSPAAVVTAPRVTEPSPPPTRHDRPEKCSDILLKASLEPLTVDEARYLRRECQ